MPPTSRLTAADRAEQRRQHGGGAGGGLRHLPHVTHGEIVLAARRNVAALAQEPLDVGLDALRVDAVAGGDGDARHVGIAGQPPLEHAQRHQHHVVLVHAEAALALGFQHPDHLAGDAGDADVALQRAQGAEQPVAHRLAQNAGGPAGADIAFDEGAAGDQRPVLGREEGLVRAVDRGDAALRAMDDGDGLLRQRRDGPKAPDLGLDGLDVADGEGAGVGAGAARAHLAAV